MRRPHGFLTPETIISLVAVATVLTIVAGAVTYANSLTAKGHKAGVAACEKDYLARDKKQLEETLAKVVTLQKAKDKLEEEAKAESSSLQLKLKEQINENRALASRNKFLTGSLSVRNDAFVRPAIPDCGAESKDTTATSRSDGATGCDLSQGAKQRLRDIGLRADKTALQLSTCQQLLLSNLRICNAE